MASLLLISSFVVQHLGLSDVHLHSLYFFPLSSLPPICPMLLPDQIFLKMWSMVHLKNNQQRYFLKCRFLGLVSEFLGIGTDYLKKLKYLKTQIRRISLFKILSAFILVCILNWKVRKRKGRR